MGVYPTNHLTQENIRLLYRTTVTAILVIAATYLLGAGLFILLFLFKRDYCFIGIVIPLLGYLWMTTAGSKYVNNRYGFKKTSAGIVIYTKKKSHYSTYMIIHVLIFFISSIVRLVYEIHNLLLIRQISNH